MVEEKQEGRGVFYPPPPGKIGLKLDSHIKTGREGGEYKTQNIVQILCNINALKILR